MTKVPVSLDTLRELEDYERRLTALERRDAGGTFVVELFDSDVCHFDQPWSVGWRVKAGTRLFVTNDNGFVRWSGQIEWYGGFTPPTGTDNIDVFFNGDPLNQATSWGAGSGIPVEVQSAEFVACMLDSHEADGSNPHVLQVYANNDAMFNANGGIYNTSDAQIAISNGSGDAMPDGYIVDLGNMAYWNFLPPGAT